MIELDRLFLPISKAINQSYSFAFPHLPRYPLFSFTRAMITLWRKKVYAKIKGNLMESFAKLLSKQRRSRGESLDFVGLFEENGMERLAKYVQTIIDLSINEVSVHSLGSTKVKLEEPYVELGKVTLKQTKYLLECV
eukprot:TRINITY_DN681_c0_g1_i6.p2 TRINITY_DN681_c0_g1~~TRINITY_DN681_c0_g1_i6.p2  ORF type:complete len:137 (-),score=30.57 TRINITY_DN681_c0_g1_i6:705-1115(-)